MRLEPILFQHHKNGCILSNYSTADMETAFSTEGEHRVSREMDTEMQTSGQVNDVQHVIDKDW